MSENTIDLAAEVAACRDCAESFAATPTAHAPRPVLQIAASAKLCIAGQAPGWRAHQNRLPFSDPSGVRLRSWMGIDAERFYDATRVAILPMGFCFPGHAPNGGDLKPPKRCAERWRARLLEAHPALELIVLVGALAQNWHLGVRFGRSVSEVVGNWRDCYEEKGLEGVRHLPLPHPSWRNTAWLKRHPWFEVEVVPFLRDRVAKLTV